jgi:hypothetical protein
LQLEPLLKSADSVAQGGLGHAQPQRCPRKAAFIGNDGKDGEFIQPGSHDHEYYS